MVASSMPLPASITQIPPSLSPSTFKDLNPSNFPPAQESRRRNAEQRAAALRSDPLIGEVEPNRVFCSLCQKWVQLRQDSSYCAYPWLQHRSKCLNKQFVLRVLPCMICTDLDTTLRTDRTADTNASAPSGRPNMLRQARSRKAKLVLTTPMSPSLRKALSPVRTRMQRKQDDGRSAKPRTSPHCLGEKTLLDGSLHLTSRILSRIRTRRVNPTIWMLI